MHRRSLALSLVLTTLLASVSAAQVDTDGDGLLDLIDVEGFDPNASGELVFNKGIQDLDGASQLTQLDRLLLYDNPITSVEPGDFHGLSKLTHLSLSGTQIDGVDAGDFRGLTNLKQLNLPSNQISSIEAGGFQGLGNLKTLDLYRNQVTTVDDESFAGLINLERLWLMENQITELAIGSFRDLGSLTHLFLDFNQIASVDPGAFQGLGNLKSLSLSRNEITLIEAGVFSGLVSLTRLFLIGNPITSIERDAFREMDSLETLFLQSDGLTELNLSGATFGDLMPTCFNAPQLGLLSGFCLLGKSTVSLSLDDANLSGDSFKAIVAETDTIADASLIGLVFSDTNPTSLADVLDIATLDNLTLDQGLFDLYTDELNTFAAEVGKTLTIIPYGDTDADGDVDFPDFLKLAGVFGKPGRWSDGDFDRSGDVQFPDFLLLAGNFGKHGQAAAVPEPVGYTWLLVFACLLWRRRRL